MVNSEKQKNYGKNLQGLKKTTNFAVANYARNMHIYNVCGGAVAKRRPIRLSVRTQDFHS